MTILLEERQTTGTDSDELLDDWWCVRTRPYRYRGYGLDIMIEFVCAVMRDSRMGEPYPAVIVWPERDDENLLRCAALSQKRGNEPEIVEFQESYGRWINWDNFVLNGGRLE